MRTINVSAGGSEYVTAQIVEANGEDITGDAVLLSLAGYSQPGTWQTPTSVHRPNDSTIEASLLVGPATAPGHYWLWAQITDNPEVIQVRCSNDRIAVVNGAAA